MIHYDGYRFRRYTRDSSSANSLGGVFIRCWLLLDKHGVVWVGSWNGFEVEVIGFVDPPLQATHMLTPTPSQNCTL